MIVILIIFLSIKWMISSDIANNKKKKNEDIKENKQTLNLKKDNEKKSFDSFMANTMPIDKKMNNKFYKKESSKTEVVDHDNKIENIYKNSKYNIKINDDMLKNYKKNDIHIEWMARIESILGDILSNVDKEALRKNHIIFLYNADILKKKYLTNEITQQEYFEELAELFKWHQEFYKKILTNEEYFKLFEISKEETDNIIDTTLTPTNIGLEIYNPNTTIDDVRKKLPKDKIDYIIMLNKKRMLKSYNIEKDLEKGMITEEEALNNLNDIYKDYIEQVKNILTQEEFYLIFGNTKNKE